MRLTGRSVQTRPPVTVAPTHWQPKVTVVAGGPGDTYAVPQPGPLSQPHTPCQQHIPPKLMTQSDCCCCWSLICPAPTYDRCLPAPLPPPPNTNHPHHHTTRTVCAGTPASTRTSTAAASSTGRTVGRPAGTACPAVTTCRGGPSTCGWPAPSREPSSAHPWRCCAS